MAKEEKDEAVAGEEEGATYQRAKHLAAVKVSDKTATPKEFWGELLGDAPAKGSDDHVWVVVYVTDPDNGFGWPIGPQVASLKHLDDGVYGA